MWHRAPEADIATGEIRQVIDQYDTLDGDYILVAAAAVIGLLNGAVASYGFGVAIYAVNGPRETLHLRQIVTTKNELMQRPVAAIIDGRRKLPVRSNPYPAATGPTV